MYGNQRVDAIARKMFFSSKIGYKFLNFEYFSVTDSDTPFSFQPFKKKQQTVKTLVSTDTSARKYFSYNDDEDSLRRGALSFLVDYIVEWNISLVR